MKKVWKYVIITLLMLLGLGCVGVLYLFFIPHSNLFNITYINNSINLKSQKYDSAIVEKVVLTSRAYDVNILSTEENTIQAEAKSRSFGFVLLKNNNFKIHESIKDGVLTINVIEPHGFTTTFNSEVNLYLPKNKAFNLDLANIKAKTTIKNEDVQIANLSYSTNNGDFNFIKGNITGNLSLDINKSTFRIYEEVTTSKNNDVSLKVTTGKFYAEHSVLGDVKVLKNERALIKINECETFNEDVTTAGGSITITKLAQIDVKSSDTNIYLHEVTEDVIIKLTGSGSVSIDIINITDGVPTITTNQGSISLDDVKSVLSVESNTGNISVWNAKKKTSVKTYNGEVQVHFSETAETYTESNNARVLIANIHNGKLTATGVDNIGSILDNYGIKIADNGRLFLKMRNVFGINDIQGNRGNISVVVNKDSDYVLKTKSESGNVRVNLAQVSEYGGYTNREEKITNVNCSSSSNSLNISTVSGNLSLLDTNFAI